jgi:AraC-like DNA-binding protein
MYLYIRFLHHMAYDLFRLGNRIIATLRANPRISLLTLSREFGIDRHTIEKAIKRETGKTFGQVAQFYRFEMTCDILQKDEILSIKEVSFKVGYKSPRAFDRFVRAFCGLTPVMLRRRLAESSSVRS